MTQVPTPSIVPLGEVAVTPFIYGRPLFRGGIDAAVCPPEGRMKRGNTLRDEPQDIPPPAKGILGGTSAHPHLKGRYLFGGPVWNHFGHFFVDCIHRLWALKISGDRYDGIVFLGVQGLQDIQKPEHLARADPPKFLATLMDLLDMPPVPVIFIREPTVIEHLDVPEPGTAPQNKVEPFYREFLELYQATLTQKLKPLIEAAPERIYMGRSHLLNKGGVLGCSFFEAKMAQMGITSTAPETMSLDQQIANLIGAKTIVFDEGSAAHPTQVLSNIDTEFLMFPRRVNNGAFGSAISQRAPFTLLAQSDNIETLPDRFGSTSSPGGMAVYRNPLPVFQRLKKHGFARGPFDLEAYRAAEEADLEASQSKTPEVRQARLDKLREIRG